MHIMALQFFVRFCHIDSDAVFATPVIYVNIERLNVNAQAKKHVRIDIEQKERKPQKCVQHAACQCASEKACAH